MSQKKISAKEFSDDIISGMNKSDLINKYKISGEEKLQALIEKLIVNGFLKNEDNIFYSKEKQCPSCGAEINKNDFECPMCGIIFSKYKKKVKNQAVENFGQKDKELYRKNSNEKENILKASNVIFIVMIIVFSLISFKIYSNYQENIRISELKKIEEQKRVAKQEILAEQERMAEQKEIAEQERIEELELEAKKVEQEYLDSFNFVSKNLIPLAANTETVVDQIQREWHDSIFKKHKKRDFNIAIKEVYIKNQKNVKHIKELSTSIAFHLKIMVPPNGKENEYNRLKEIYLIFNKFANMAISPSGSLREYSRIQNELKVEIMSVIKEIEMMESFSSVYS